MRPRDRHVLHARYLLSHFEGVDTVSYEFMYLFLFSFSLFLSKLFVNIFSGVLKNLKLISNLELAEIKLLSSILRVTTTEYKLTYNVFQYFVSDSIISVNTLGIFLTFVIEYFYLSQIMYSIIYLLIKTLKYQNLEIVVNFMTFPIRYWLNDRVLRLKWLSRKL